MIQEPDWQPCAACKAPIFMATHERTGKHAPLLRPREGGPEPNIIAWPMSNRKWQYRILTKADRAQGATGEYINHFADCFAATQFHKKSPSGGNQ